MLPVLRWSGPDEDQRQAAVRAWKRAIQITVDLGVDVMNTEFNGRPEAAEHAEAQFLKSMDELLPIFEREGMQLILEPHPDDFIEDGIEAREDGPRPEQRLDRLPVLHAARVPPGPRRRPTIIEAAAEKVRYVHLADAWNHTASNGLRYITNPPGNTVRVHQHMEMGRGEVDFDAVFAALAAVGFDGVISSCVFGWEEDARGVSVRQRDKALALIDKHFGERGRSVRSPRAKITTRATPHRKESTMATTLHHWKNGAIFEGIGGRFSDVTNPATGEVTAQLALA